VSCFPGEGSPKKRSGGRAAPSDGLAENATADGRRRVVRRDPRRRHPRQDRMLPRRSDNSPAHRSMISNRRVYEGGCDSRRVENAGFAKNPRHFRGGAGTGEGMRARRPYAFQETGWVCMSVFCLMGSGARQLRGDPENPKMTRILWFFSAKQRLRCRRASNPASGGQRSIIDDDERRTRAPGR